mgnify:CR=1 FL=1
MGILDFIWEGLKALGHWFVELINRLIDFARDVLTWFQSQNLDRRKDTPFLMRVNDEMRRKLAKAPRRNVPGLFRGVYNEQADTITGDEIDSTEGLDSKTREILGGEELVVLQ